MRTNSGTATREADLFGFMKVRFVRQSFSLLLDEFLGIFHDNIVVVVGVWIPIFFVGRGQT